VKTINVPFRFDEGEVTTTSSVDNIVKQEIVNYFMTNTDERVMNATYGGNLQRLAFEINDPLVIADYKVDALPDINSKLSFGKVLDVSVAETTDDTYYNSNTATITIRYAVAPRTISTVKLVVNETFTEESDI
jgi:hypothetical protein